LHVRHHEQDIPLLALRYRALPPSSRILPTNHSPLTDLKTTLDDHLPIYLSSPNLPTASGPPLPKPLRFTPSYTTTYVRLFLGYSSVLIAAYLFYLDYYLKIPFRLHKVTAAWCGLGYFLLNGALTAWIWLVEKGVVFEGSRKDGVSVKVYSLGMAGKRKWEPVYRLVLVWEGGKGGKGGRKEVEVGFEGFFEGNGMFVPARFEEWLRGVMPVIQDGMKQVAADPAQAATSSVEVGGTANGTKRRN